MYVRKRGSWTGHKSCARRRGHPAVDPRRGLETHGRFVCSRGGGGDARGRRETTRAVPQHAASTSCAAKWVEEGARRCNVTALDTHFRNSCEKTTKIIVTFLFRWCERRGRTRTEHRTRPRRGPLWLSLRGYGDGRNRCVCVSFERDRPFVVSPRVRLGTESRNAHHVFWK